MALLVSRQVLKDIVKPEGRVDELDAHVREFSYDDFRDVHLEFLKEELGKRRQWEEWEDEYSRAYDRLCREYLKQRCPPIKYIAQGSSRAAYALAGGKCLKIAGTKAGLAQNKQELKNTADTSLMCFTQVYDWDEGTFASILTECCALAEEKDFMMLLGLKPIEIEQVLGAVIRNEGAKGALRELNNDYDEMHSAGEDAIDSSLMREIESTQRMMKFLNEVLKLKTPQAEVIADLFKFYEMHHWDKDELLPDDLSNVGNWGIVARGGRECLVILDAGFSEKVADTYYN